MADFEALAYKITVRKHPDADTLDVIAVGGYECISRLGQYKDGDIIVHIPEASIVPDDILEELGLVGMLSGGKNNRVKAKRLRGILSQGLVYPISGKRLDGINIEIGKDYADILGLVKYEPPIPISMRGKIIRSDRLVHYDIDDVKKHDGVLIQDEQIIATEKIHGTLCRVTWYNEEKEWRVSSKGQGNRGLSFSEDDQSVYSRMFKKHTDDFESVRDKINDEFTIFAEVYGKGIQDLTYGKNTPHIILFDIYVGKDRFGEYIGAKEILSLLEDTKLEYVPVVYEGSYKLDLEKELRGGKSLIDGADNMREGVVIRPVPERRTKFHERVCLKSVSDAYLTRKGGTEYN